jgi:hypothetical protein
MSKKDPSEGSPAKPAHARRVLLRPRIFDQLERLAERDESDVAELANLAARELLEKRGFWPPKDGADE